jgi:hypothetical protein
MAAYSYKTKELLDSKVNFAAIYFDKQERIKEMTGFDFNLADIVRFVKSETDNFQNQIELAMEIDKAIYGIYNNWIRETGEKQPAPAPAPAAEPSGEQSNEEAEWQEAVETLKMLIEDGDASKKQIKEWQEAVETLEMLLNP